MKTTSASPSKSSSLTVTHGPPTTTKTPRRLSSVRISLHPAALDDHSGQADDVGPGTAIEVDVLDILVEQGHRCPGGVKAASSGRQATGMLARLPR